MKTRMLLIHGGMTFKNKNDYIKYLKTRKLKLTKVLWKSRYKKQTEEIVKEYATKIREESEKLKRIKEARETAKKEGICEECGCTDILYRIDGKLLCEECKNCI